MSLRPVMSTELMSTHGIRRFPVVDRGGKLIGVLTLDDILCPYPL